MCWQASVRRKASCRVQPLLLLKEQALLCVHSCSCLYASYRPYTAANPESHVLQGAPHLLLSNVTLQGASFDGSRLRPVTSDSPTNNLMPPIALAWVPKQMQDLATQLVSIPLYSEAERRTAVASLQLPVADATAKQQYLLLGVAASLLM